MIVIDPLFDDLLGVMRATSVIYLEFISAS
jgi:hypothetical protein